MRLKSYRFPAALLSCLLFSSAAIADDKTAAICAEAEERYVDLFGNPSSNEEGVTVVLMYKYKFCPEQLEVPMGTTVRWVNVDKRTSHSVIVKDSDTPESDRLFSEEYTEFTFYIPGPQDILCGPHWETRDMLSRITVKP
ncbi:MAG: copper-binding protein [Roseibium sp.]